MNVINVRNVVNECGNVVNVVNVGMGPVQLSQTLGFFNCYAELYFCLE